MKHVLVVLKFKSNIAQRQETQVDKLGKSFTKTIYYFEEEDECEERGINAEARVV